MTEPRTRAPRRRAGSPLAVVSAALASFLVVLALLTARVVTGTDPSLRPAAQTQQLVAHNGKTVIRTTASGRRIVESVPAGGKAATTPVGLVSRTSGGGESDG